MTRPPGTVPGQQVGAARGGAVGLGLGGAALAGAAVVVAACALVPDPSTNVLVWLGGFGLVAHLLLVVAAVVATTTIRSRTAAAPDAVRVGLARRLLLIITVAAVLAAGSAGFAAFAVTLSYDLSWPALCMLLLTIASLPVTVLLPVGIVMFNGAFAVPSMPGVGLPTSVHLPIERTRRMVACLRMIAATLTALGVVGVAGTIARWRLDPSATLIEVSCAVPAHLMPIVGAVIALTAAGTVTGGRVDVTTLNARRQALDVLSAVAVFVVDLAWLYLGINATGWKPESWSPALTLINFVLLALTLLVPPLSHALAHRTLTVLPSAVPVPPHAGVAYPHPGWRPAGWQPPGWPPPG